MHQYQTKDLKGIISRPKFKEYYDKGWMPFFTKEKKISQTWLYSSDLDLEEIADRIYRIKKKNWLNGGQRKGQVRNKRKGKRK